MDRKDSLQVGPMLQSDAIRRAMEYGVDITLLIENLKLTPTERLAKAQRVLASALAFRAEVARARWAQEVKRAYDPN